MQYKEWREYKCIKPLTVKQLYLPPNMQNAITIQQGGVWWLVSSDKTKGHVTLEKKGIQPVQMRLRIGVESFSEHFEEVMI